MVTSVFDQIIPFVYIVIALTAGGIFLKFYLNYKADLGYNEEKAVKATQRPEVQFDSFLSNIDTIIADRKKTLEQAILEAPKDANGAMVETALIKRLKNEIHWMSMINDYKPAVELIGKPLILGAIKVINGIAKGFGRF